MFQNVIDLGHAIGPSCDGIPTYPGHARDISFSVPRNFEDPVPRPIPL